MVQDSYQLIYDGLSLTAVALPERLARVIGAILSVCLCLN